MVSDDYKREATRRVIDLESTDYAAGLCVARDLSVELSSVDDWQDAQGGILSAGWRPKAELDSRISAYRNKAMLATGRTCSGSRVDTSPPGDDSVIGNIDPLDVKTGIDKLTDDVKKALSDTKTLAVLAIVLLVLWKVR